MPPSNISSNIVVIQAVHSEHNMLNRELSELDACLILSVFICERLEKVLDFFFFVFKLRLRTKMLRDVSVRGFSVLCLC